MAKTHLKLFQCFTEFLGQQKHVEINLYKLFVLETMHELLHKEALSELIYQLIKNCKKGNRELKTVFVKNLPIVISLRPLINLGLEKKR